MSFSFEFIAKKSDASLIVFMEHAPSDVKEFIQQALTAFKPDDLVFVKAVGHLYHNDNDYETSTAIIDVHKVVLRVPTK